MSKLKRIEGRVIKSLNKGTDSVNSFVTIKFEGGGKLNIVAFPTEKIGTAQIDLKLNGVSFEEINGSKIISANEEFDGENDSIIINLQNGKTIEIYAFCSSDEGDVDLSYTLYAEEKLVQESLYEYYNVSKYGYQSDSDLPEDELFNNEISKLEHKLYTEYPDKWEEYNRLSNKLWYHLGVDNWIDAFNNDPKACIKLKQYLEDLNN